MNFKEPISTFAYNLISLHHDIIWYIILILSLVYWTLYKIIKEFLWSIGPKQDGFSIVFYKNNRLYKLQAIILFIWFKLFYKVIEVVYSFSVKIYIALTKNILNNQKSPNDKLSFFF